jgi:hypothetical protein
MPVFKSPPALRLVTTFGAACVLTATIAACSSSAPETSSPAASTQAAPAPSRTPAAAPSSGASTPVASVTASSPVASATVPSAPASVAATPTPASVAAGCASSRVEPVAGVQASGSITVCPDAAPVGGVVHITIAGCAPAGSGLPDLPAAALSFLGPDSWLGTNGGGGANVSFAPKTGHLATATFTIPATYTGGNENGPYPALDTKPGNGYQFVTDPAGDCNVRFTVLPD